MTFLQESDTEFINHTPMEAYTQELLTNTKHSKVCACVCFCVVAVVKAWFFCLLGFVLLIFG